MIRPLAVALGLVLVGPCGAVAQEAKPACPTVDMSLPGTLATWTARTPLKAAGALDGVQAAALNLGQAVDAALRSTATVAFAAPPARPGGDATYGGLLALNLDRPGTYRIVLSAPAWIDVIDNGKALPSAAHQHGPACSTAHKMVDFALEPGPHVVQISGSPDAVIGVLVARTP